jgi:hypothetical protein
MTRSARDGPWRSWRACRVSALRAARSTPDGHSRSARLARQTRAQGLAELRVADAPGEPALQGRPQKVGASAGGVGLLGGGDEGRAHGGRHLAAAAAAVALLEVGHETQVALDEPQPFHRRQADCGAGFQTQVAVQRPASGVHHFAGIQALVGIEQRLDLPVDLHQIVTQVGRGVLGAGHAQAVLAAQRAAETRHQVGHLVAHLAQAHEVRGQVQIQRRADVEQAGGGVAVERGLETHGVENLAKPVDVGRQVLGADAGVLDAGGGLDGTGAAGDQGQTGPAEAPHQLLLPGICADHGAEPEVQLPDLIHAVAVIVEELDQEEALAGRIVQTQQGAGRCERGLTLALAEDDAVQVLHRRGRQRQQLHRRLHGFGHRGEADDRQTAGRGPRNGPQPGRSDDRQRALAAGDQTGEVVGMVEEPIQAVPGPALDQDIGHPFANGGGVGVHQALGPGPQGLQVGVVASHPGDAAVRQNQLQGFHVACGGAVDRGVGARGVVGYHSAQGRSGRSGDIGAEPPSVGRQRPVEGVQDHAASDRDVAGVGMHGIEVGQVAGQVHDQTVAQGAADQAAPCAPRRDREPFVRRPPHDRRDLGGVRGKGHGGRCHLMDGRIGGVQRPAGGIDADVEVVGERGGHEAIISRAGQGPS